MPRHRLTTLPSLGAALVAAGTLTACADSPTAPAAAPRPTAAASFDRHAGAASAASAASGDSMPQPAAGLSESDSQAAKLAAVRRGAQTGDNRIPGQYVVVFKDDVPDAPGLAKRLSAAHGASPRYTYDGVLKGFSFKLPAAAAEQVAAALARNPNVAYVEQDAEPRQNAVQYFNYTDSYADAWGLDRIDQRALPLSATSTYGYTGAGIRVYILDTGLQTSHPEFGGRAQIAFDAFGGTGYDCEGHGTHVAGTVGGNTYGVAKGAMLRGVKVLRGRGCGTESWDAILAGLDWVYKYRVNPAVVNMSLGGGYWQPVNDAVTRLANAGVFVAVAAGNENQDACKVTPASAPGTFTVAASSRSDTRVVYSTWGSNWGGCVDAYAPGDEIMSAWPGGRVYAQSGTSMAAPHVAGVAALYKQAYGNAASSTIVNWLIYNSTKSAIRNDYTGTPNRLLWKGNL